MKTKKEESDSIFHTANDGENLQWAERFDIENLSDKNDKVREKFHPVLENSLVGFIIICEDRIGFCNQKLADLFGYDNRNDLIGISIKKLIFPSEWKKLEELWNCWEVGQESIQGEFSAIKPSGETIYFELVGSPVLYNGKPALQAAIRDITSQKEAQLALLKSEKKFRYLFEGSPDAIYVLDPKGTILEANLAATLLHEMGKSELINQSIFELIDEDIRQEVKDDINALLSGELNFYETTLITASGLKIPVEIRSRQVNLDQETHIMFYIRDISERVSVGRKFLESQRTLSNFMSNLPGMAYRRLNDDKYTMKFVSHGSIGVTGYKPEDFIDNNKVSYANLIEPRFREGIRYQVESAIAAGRPFRLEYQIRTANGKKKWIWEQGRGVFDDRGNLIALEGIILDITHQKEAEIAVRESEKRFRSLIEDVPSISVIGYDTQHRIFFWNKASEQFFGYSAEEVCNQLLEEVIFPANSRVTIKTMINDWLKGGKEILPSETTFVRKDGSKFVAHSSHVMLRNSKNEQELYCLNVDLTELHKIKQDLQQSLQNLKEALDGTIRALTTAVETRDPYTAGHQVGVAKLACAIARELKLDENRIEGLRVACLLHDIGNLNVPAEILNKPGQLSDIEYTLLKFHPQHGYEILRRINFPWPVADMVLQHHERLDGSGYPKGLKNDEIMLEAKIIAVADVIEPMSSHRPYRPALGIKKAIDEIQKGRGKLYDPEIVDICVSLFREKGFHFDENNV